MEKLKSGEPRDRLSELPDSLIFNIFEFLLMTDVVRTAVLSRRWRNLWNKTPNLNFDNSEGEIDYDDADKFRNFVNRALLRWRGTRVNKFKVSCSDNDGDDNSLVADVDSWLHFAIDNGVEDLYISYCQYRVPQCLYSCSSLKNLCFEWCDFKINGNVEWNRLKSLAIVQCYGLTQRVIDQILRGSPLLEIFTLSGVHTYENLSFRSSSLKELSFYQSIGHDTELRISTPNLETLTIWGIEYSKYLLENVSSLTQATLSFHRKDFVGYRIHDILSIQQAESITLLDWPTKMIGTKRICTLPNVKFLKLGSVEEHQDIVRLLENFPNVKTLVLRDKMYVSSRFTAESCQEYKLDYPSGPFVTELTIVEVTWNGSDSSIFPLIEVLLKCASKLEKMVFRVKWFKPPSGPSLPSNSLLLASQKLLRMQRSYPNVELILYEC